MDKPWPALVEKSMSIDFSTLDQTDHGHVPFVYILVQAAEKWKASVRVARTTFILPHNVLIYLNQPLSAARRQAPRDIRGEERVQSRD